MFEKQVRSGVAHVGLALREPEEFVARWDAGEAQYAKWVWMSLIGTAILGTTTYGMTMGILGGAGDILRSAAICTLAAGMAWSISLPTLYILNSFTGSQLKASTTVLAAIVTTSWGGLAMLASIPINWFFTVAVPHPTFVLFINLVVFAGVGTAMADTFGRVMARIEPTRGRLPLWWLVLVGGIGAELFYLFGLFEFGS